MDYEARRVLLCLRYGIGDVVMELPVLEALRHALPSAHITALGASPAVELLRESSTVDAVVDLRRWGLTHRWDHGTGATREAIHQWLDLNRFDLHLDVHHVAPVVGEIVWGRGIRSLEADEDAEAEAVSRGADGVRAIKAAVRAGWGLEVPEATLPTLSLHASERDFARAFLQEHDVDEPPFGISPVASHALKRWPAERFAAVADHLIESHDRPVLLFSGPQDRAADSLCSSMRHPDRVVRVGAIHLRYVAAILEHCRAFVCNDTGLMHMAAAVGTRTVGVFGPTSPDIYLPPGVHARSAPTQPVACPYLNTRSLHPPECFAAGECLTGDRGCIEQVQPNDVLVALDALADADEYRSAGHVHTAARTATAASGL